MEFTVNQMTCGHCARSIANAVQEMDPGAFVEVDLAAKRVIVMSNKADGASVEAAITRAGYVVQREDA